MGRSEYERGGNCRGSIVVGYGEMEERGRGEETIGEESRGEQRRAEQSRADQRRRGIAL